MILLHLEKKSPSNKMFIKDWEFLTKELTQSVKQIPSVRVVVEEKQLPVDFYKNHKNYFIEDNIIRYSSI